MPVFQIKKFTKKHTSVVIHVLSDGPLENLWGGGGGEEQKKNLHATEN